MAASMLMSTKHLFPDWMDRMLADSEFEASQSQVQLLQDEGRNIVWKMCEWFGCEAHGVPGQACRLLERYLFQLIHEHGNDENLEALQQSLYPRVPLFTASCIMLAAKMSDSALPVVAVEIHTVLLCKNISFPVDDIIASEFQVYRTLGFRMPLWTSVEIGEILAVEVGFPLNILDNVAKVVDLAELKRHIINRKLRWVANVAHLESKSDSVLSLHLAAGAVAAAARLFHCDKDNAALPRLASLTKVNRTYIKCIQDLICIEILSEIRRNSGASSPTDPK